MDKHRTLAIAIFFLSILIGTSSESGEIFLVVATEGNTTIQYGQIVGPDTIVALEKGNRLRLFGEDGRIVDLEGPVSGGLQAHIKENKSSIGARSSSAPSQSGTSRNFGLLKRLFLALRAGGGIRSVSRIAIDDPWLIDTTTSGAKCVNRTPAELKLWAPNTGETRTIQIETIDGRHAEDVTFGKNDTRRNWPLTVPLSHDSVYIARPSGPGRSRQWTIKIAPQTMSIDKKALQWLLLQKCNDQALVLVNKIPPDQRAGSTVTDR